MGGARNSLVIFFFFNGALSLIEIIERHLALRSTLAKGLTAFYCLILFTPSEVKPLITPNLQIA